MPKSKTAYYAVYTGREPGIYTTWDECKKQTDKFPNAKYKKFFTHQDACTFLQGIDFKIGKDLAIKISNANMPSENSLIEFLPNLDFPKPHNLVVWTDGSSRNNGKHNARAGIGVYWGDNDPRNLSERLPGYKQTNNRAEITAIIRALQTCTDLDSPLEIRTDSIYIVKDVENRDLFIKLTNLIRARPGHVIITHVRGHQGLAGNEGADKLANLGALLPDVEEDDS
nr:5046_t:CDS:2 [Entrophospora candida]CAG8589968.1 12476_t:CDS:2 [Entrophospora candida]